MLGDPTLFTRTDEVESAWRFITPILDAWDQPRRPPARPLRRRHLGTRGGRRPDRRDDAAVAKTLDAQPSQARGRARPMSNLPTTAPVTTTQRPWPGFRLNSTRALLVVIALVAGLLGAERVLAPGLGFLADRQATGRSLHPHGLRTRRPGGPERQSAIPSGHQPDRLPAAPSLWRPQP